MQQSALIAVSSLVWCVCAFRAQLDYSITVSITDTQISHLWSFESRDSWRTLCNKYKKVIKIAVDDMIKLHCTMNINAKCYGAKCSS